MMIVGEGAMKRMEHLHSESQKFGVEPVSHFMAKPLISPETPHMYDRAKAHKSSDSRGRESELFRSFC